MCIDSVCIGVYNVCMKIQPRSVLKLYCPSCKDLQVKVYPYSSITYPSGQAIPLCAKCLNEIEEKKKQGKFIPDLARLGGRLI